ncbi:PhnD/SsuA/transferrin family substrate-binding protein [Pseudomonas helleri]|uniref:PhnD/SsuA/transferrin family substrate-binding protein n=1 Tax=Pseudomonas helleri TaxID=1608996 RepID=A0A7X1XBE2_9PSED|nr:MULTISPECIES: ABC transporter substrate-binding protein [Pseudomonas]MQT46174.1 PhnD/SsuA/transferrin family substrate-binding protein [Pseudomonas helleri]MQT57310.1 PhnD/SsuA/transferrin family substrate-binding protein [Pseudomonas sp. FSL R10-0399]MQT88258.1 PhnD/SsuA/transferrin family substrate-binding protein [Pseudomonas helleri]
MKHTLLTSLLVALLGSNLSVALADAPNPQVIHFGMATVGKGGVPYSVDNTSELAHQLHTIEDELKADNIQVEWHYFKGAGPAVNEALANQQLDFSMQGDLPATIGKAGGLDTRLLATDRLLNSTYLVVPVDSPAKALKDLKGKRVALFKGTNLHLATLRTLGHEGFNERDFRFLNMDTATASAALASKDIDAGWYGPEAFELQNRGLGRIIYDSAQVNDNLTRQAHVLVRGEFEREHPHVVQKVVNGLVKAAAWAADPNNRESALAMWAKSGTSIETLREIHTGKSFVRNYSPRIDPFFIARYRATVTEAKALRLIRGDIDVDQWIEPKYVDTAIEQLGFQALWPSYDANNQPIPK